MSTPCSADGACATDGAVRSVVERACRGDATRRRGDDSDDDVGAAAAGAAAAGEGSSGAARSPLRRSARRAVRGRRRVSLVESAGPLLRRGEARHS